MLDAGEDAIRGDAKRGTCSCKLDRTKMLHKTTNRTLDWTQNRRMNSERDAYAAPDNGQNGPDDAG